MPVHAVCGPAAGRLAQPHLCRENQSRISQWVSFESQYGEYVHRRYHPAHGGAGPAQIYIYMRNGLSFTSAFAISLINMAATLIFMPLAALAALLLVHHQFESGVIPALLKYGFIFFTLFLFAFLLAFKKPLDNGTELVF